MTNLQKIWSLIKSDYDKYNQANEIRLKGPIINAIFCLHPCYAYSFWMRLSSLSNPFRVIARIVHIRLSRKYGIQIHPSTQIGKGLYIAHGVGIIINPQTKIGDNCIISHLVSIGTNKRTPATIGNNVYIGPGVCIVENVTIGDNVKIGAGSVVINDIPGNSTSVGNPNRIIIRK